MSRLSENLISYETHTVQRQNVIQRIWKKIFPIGFLEEFKELFALAWPAVMTSFFQLFLQTVSIIVCGHLDKLQLDGAALANSMINVAGISVGMGLSTACDTFFSQTFGSDNKKRVGTYLQRSLLIMNLFAVCICCLHINVEPILNLIGQEPEVAKLAADYMLCFLPGVFFDFNFLTLARYLQNQNIVYPSMICALIGNIFNIVSQILCIYVFKFSYLASAVCQATSLGVMFITQLGYILISKVYVTTWDGWKAQDTFSGWGMFVRLAVPGIFMVGLEEWSFEIATLVAGTFDTIQLGVQSILFQIEAMTYMLPLGCSIAVNIRVGQHLGANRPDHAKTTFRVGLTIALVAATIIGAICVSLRNYIPLIFTTDKEIINGVAAILILSAGFQYCDGISATCSGTFRGCGRQLTGAIILFFGYYVISLPIGITLATVVNMKVYGMWVGLLIGIGLEAIVFVIVVLKTDWDYQCKNAQKVAYDGMDVGELTDLDAPSSAVETEQENDPLLGTPKRKRHHSVSSVRSSRRASVHIRDLALDEVQEGSIRKLVCKRLAVFLFVAIFIVAAVTLRIFQPQFCVPDERITIDYAGILPLCNQTLNLTVLNEIV